MSELCFIFHKNNLLIKKARPYFTTLQDINKLELINETPISIHNNQWAIDLKSEVLNREYQYSSLRSLFEILSPEEHIWANRAFQLLHWERTNQFCGQCGARLQNKATERAKVCSECDFTSYPKVSPAVIVLVTRGPEMLLAQNAQRVSGFYSTLAGFMDVGETLEDTIHREIKEEVGVEVTNLRYFGSQTWPFPNNVMIGFIADYKSGEIKIDKSEIADAKWFLPQDLPPVPPSFSIARQMIQSHCEKHKGNK